MRSVRLLAAAVLGAASLGLGGGGGVKPGKVPIPARNFTAEVTDRQGVVTRTSRVSCGGEVFLAGKRGETTLTVGFDRIRRIRFSAPGEKTEKAVEAIVEMAGSSEPLRLRVDRDFVCAGVTDFGTVQVEAGDLQAITFTGEVAEGSGARPRGDGTPPRR